jgi:Asp-tRNA(Asn)/Glu-tRNA(Gln) amidotransferase C subunit
MDKKNIIIAPSYPMREEKLAHLVKLTADELSKNENPKVKRKLVNQLQFFRRLWERENKEDE